MINTGVKTFVRTEAHGKALVGEEGATESSRAAIVRFRLHADAVELFRLFMNDRRVVDMDREDIKVMLTHDQPKFEEFSSTVAERLRSMGALRMLREMSLTPA